MENMQTVAGADNELSDRAPKLNTDLVNAIAFIWISSRVFSAVISSSVLYKLLKVFAAGAVSDEAAASSVTDTQVQPTPAPASQNSRGLWARMLQTVAAIITYK